MKKTTIILSTLLLFISRIGVGQSYSIELPYEVVQGKMIVKAIVEGVEGNYLFDSGASTMITHDYFNKLTTKIINEKTITDVHKQEVTLEETTLESILLGTERHIEFQQVKTLVLNEGNPVEYLNVNGIIGANLFNNLVLRIDSKRKVITISNNTDEYSLTPLYQIKMHPNGQNLPIIKVNMGNYTELVLFDTGADLFYSMNTPTYEKVKDSGFIETLFSGFGATSMGLSGAEEASEKFRIKIPQIKIGRGKFQNITAETMTSPISLLGTKLLDYGIVTIDFAQGLFYFEPYDESTLPDLYRKRWNIDITPSGDHLIVGGVWGSMKKQLEGGERIISINGEKIGKVNLQDVLSKNIVNLDGEKIKIVVLNKKGEEKEIVISKE